MKRCMIIVFLFLFLGVVGDIFGSERVFRWTREGTSPFWQTPLRSEQDLQALFNNSAFRSKLARGLQSAESGWNGDEAVRQIDAAVKTGNFQRITVTPSSPEASFDWMLYGVSNQNTGPTVWAGSHNLNGYLISFEYKGRQEILLGNACVNVLKRRSRTEAPPGEYERVQYAQAPPQQQQQVILYGQQFQPCYSPCYPCYPSTYYGGYYGPYSGWYGRFDGGWGNFYGDYYSGWGGGYYYRGGGYHHRGGHYYRGGGHYYRGGVRPPGVRTR